MKIKLVELQQSLRLISEFAKVDKEKIRIRNFKKKGVSLIQAVGLESMISVAVKNFDDGAYYPKEVIFGRSFLTMIRNIPVYDGEQMVSFMEHGNSILCTIGSLSFCTAPVMEPFPIREKIYSPDIDLVIDAKKFRDAYHYVSHSIDTLSGDARELCTLYINGENDMTMMGASTPGISVYETSKEKGRSTFDMEKAITMQGFVGAFLAKNARGDIMIKKNHSGMEIMNQNIYLSIESPGSPFNVKKMMDFHYPYSCRMDRRMLEASVRMIRLGSKKISIRITKNVLYLNSAIFKNDDMREIIPVNDSIPCQVNGDFRELRLNMSSVQLSEFLNAVDDEEVVFYFKDNSSGIYFEGENYREVIFTMN